MCIAHVICAYVFMLTVIISRINGYNRFKTLRTWTMMTGKNTRVCQVFIYAYRAWIKIVALNRELLYYMKIITSLRSLPTTVPEEFLEPSKFETEQTIHCSSWNLRTYGVFQYGNIKRTSQFLNFRLVIGNL